MPELHQAVEELARIESRDAPILSVFLNVSPRPSDRSDVGTRLRNLLRPVREHTQVLDHAAATSLRHAIDGALDLEPRIVAETDGTGIAYFACPPLRLDRYVAVPRPIWDQAVVASRPYLRPLRGVLDEFHRALTVVVEPRRSHLWISWMGEIELEETLEGEVVRKADYGGWYGLDEWSARHAADGARHRHYRDLAERIADLRRSRHVEVMFVGGRSQSITEFVPFLSRRDRDMVADTFTVDVHTLGRRQVLEMTRRLEEAWEERRKGDAADALIEAEQAGGLAVTGLAGVIEAVNIGAVNDLLVANGSVEPGWECLICGAVSIEGPTCQRCGGHCHPEPDVIDRVEARVLAEGGTVEHLTSTLSAAKVGATLRFPLPGQRRSLSEGIGTDVPVDG